jgi:hypothetical protein
VAAAIDSPGTKSGDAPAARPGVARRTTPVQAQAPTPTPVGPASEPVPVEPVENLEPVVEPAPRAALPVIGLLCGEPDLPPAGVTLTEATLLAEPRELGRTVTTVPSGIQVDLVGRSGTWMSIRLAGASVSGYLHCSTLRALTPRPSPGGDANLTAAGAF